MYLCCYLIKQRVGVFFFSYLSRAPRHQLRVESDCGSCRVAQRDAMRNDAFMMDVENEILREWLGVRSEVLVFALAKREFPKGTARVQDAAWAAHVKACLKAWYGRGDRSPVSRREGGRDEVSWAEYKTWVEAGGGDEWFHP